MLMRYIDIYKERSYISIMILVEALTKVTLMHMYVSTIAKIYKLLSVLNQPNYAHRLVKFLSLFHLIVFPILKIYI